MIILPQRTKGKLTNNKSLYARHRSNSQLVNEVGRLKSEYRPIFLKFKGTWVLLHQRLQQDDLHGKYLDEYDDVRRMNEIREQFGRKPHALPIPRSWEGCMHQDLKKDLSLIWGDFCQISFYRRPYGETYNNLLLVVAISATDIDIIFSKSCYDQSGHFYHWRAVSQTNEPLLLDPEVVRTNGMPGFTLII